MVNGVPECPGHEQSFIEGGGPQTQVVELGGGVVYFSCFVWYSYVRNDSNLMSQQV